MSSTSTRPVGELIRAFVGPPLIGTLLNWGLFGIVGFQAYIYFAKMFRDSLWVRGMVIFVLVIDVLQTVFSTHSLWVTVIVHWGDPTGVVIVPWSSYSIPIFASITSVIVQIFFSWRIFSVGKGIYRCISIFIVLVAMMQCTAGVVIAIQWRTLGVNRASHMRPLPIVWLAGSAVCDIAIATTMSYILTSAKSPFIFARTRAMLDKLITQVIESGAITAVIATIELILFLVGPNDYMYMALVISIGKVYSNVLLANLNSRQNRTGKIFEASVSARQTNEMEIYTIRHDDLAMQTKLYTADTSR